MKLKHWAGSIIFFGKLLILKAHCVIFKGIYQHEMDKKCSEVFFLLDKVIKNK